MSAAEQFTRSAASFERAWRVRFLAEGDTEIFVERISDQLRQMAGHDYSPLPGLTTDSSGRPCAWRLQENLVDDLKTTLGMEMLRNRMAQSIFERRFPQRPARAEPRQGAAR